MQQEARAHIMCVRVFSRLSEDSLWHNAALLLTLCEGMNEQVTSAWATVSLATSAELHRIFLFAVDWTGGCSRWRDEKEGEEGREQEGKEIE